MEKDYFLDFFNGGLSVPKDAQADNKKSFALTENEVAFVNAIDFMENSFRSFMTSVIADLQEKTEAKNLEFMTIKSDFVKALAAKHNLGNTEGLKIDARNGLLVIQKNE